MAEDGTSNAVTCEREVQTEEDERRDLCMQVGLFGDQPHDKEGQLTTVTQYMAYYVSNEVRQQTPLCSSIDPATSCFWRKVVGDSGGSND